jgi:hypothetical protein
MITSNFINLMKSILSSAQSNKSYNVPIKDTTGTTRYLNFRRDSGGFPYNLSTSVSTNLPSLTRGIVLGSGTSEPTVNDYFLENYLTSDFSANTTVAAGVDNGDVYTDFIITITNTGNSTLTIGEIGYVQYIACTSTVGQTSSSTSSCLLDHTVLDTPVEIAPGDYETIRYRLNTSSPN